MAKYPYRKSSISNSAMSANGASASGNASPSEKRVPKRVYISPDKDNRGFRKMSSELESGARSPGEATSKPVDAYYSEMNVRARNRGTGGDYVDKAIDAVTGAKPKDQYTNKTGAFAERKRPYKRLK